ncbi:MAG: hypothetical protein ACTHMG_05110 [Sphingomonas sp.]
MRKAAFCCAAGLFALAACHGGQSSPDNPTPTPTPAPTPTPSPSPAATAFTPAAGASDAYVDTTLQITFDAPPTLGTAGTIKVFKKDGTLVDTIDVGSGAVDQGGETQTTFAHANTAIDKLGNNVPGLTQWRYVYYRPVSIDGNRATIKLHDNVLDYGTNYYVTVDPGVFVGTVDGKAFNGVADAVSWTFTTKDKPQSRLAVSVDDDGMADFRSVQGALDWVMASGCADCASADAAKTITVHDGIYRGLLFLRNADNLTIKGDSRDGTVVEADNSDAFNSGSGGSKADPGTGLTNIGGSSALGNRRVLGGGRSVMLVEGGDMLHLTNFTLRNTHVKDADTHGQAEAIYYNSSSMSGSRMIADNMNFISTQDTLQLKGWVWIDNSLVAGDVDFIWGYPYAVLLEESELRTVADTAQPDSGGYIFQSRAIRGYPGFVVLNSALTAADGVPQKSTYLARSGGASQADGYCTTAATPGGSVGNAQRYCDIVAYINTKMGPHIAPVGWYDNPPPNLMPTKTEGWREAGTMNADGSPASLDARDTTIASHSIDLSGLDTRAEVFAGWNGGAGWVPTP